MVLATDDGTDVITSDKFVELLTKSPRATRVVEYLFAGAFSTFKLNILTVQE